MPSSRLSSDSGYSPSFQTYPKPQEDTGTPQATAAHSRPAETLPPVSSITLESLGLPSSNLPPPQPGSCQDSITLLSNPPIQPRNPPNSDLVTCITLPPRFYPDPVTSGTTLKFIMSLCELSISCAARLTLNKPQTNHCFNPSRLSQSLNISSTCKFTSRPASRRLNSHTVRCILGRRSSGRCCRVDNRVIYALTTPGSNV